MPDLLPFRAVRYNPDRVEMADVVAPPYDVVDADERARLEARSPYNVVAIDLSRDEAGRDRYDAARCRFDEWLAEGVLVTDPTPAFYLYRMGWRDADGEPRQMSGVLGALALDPDRTGSVLPHERTMAKPLDDRLRLLRSCQADISPIWGLSMAPGLSGLCQPEGPPLARCTDDDGVHHRLWQVTAPAAIEALRSTVASAPVVIADGHHRYETALAYRAERHRANGDQPGPYDYVLTYLVELAEDEVGVRPIHRLLSGLPDGLSLVDELATTFVAEPVGPPSESLLDRMAAASALGLVEAGQAWLLRPRATQAGATAAAHEDATEVEADSERLEAVLAGLPDHTVAFHHDARHVLALVEKGEAQAGVLLRPVGVAQIAAAARAGQRLPQKTTFFYPKPRTGLVFRRLVE